MGRVLSPHQPDVLALREAKQVALRSARVPCGATHISLPRHGKGDRPMLLRLILVLSILLATPYAYGQGGVNVMPTELVEIAKRNGCVQLSDFFDGRPGPVNPPYAYGYLAGHAEDSAVFWCKNVESEVAPYSLIVVMRDSEHELTNLAECPHRIFWGNPPGGLSIYKNRQTTLDGFIYLSDPRRKVNEKTKMTHNAIRSYYDGVAELFYCHKGKWLVRQSD